MTIFNYEIPLEVYIDLTLSKWESLIGLNSISFFGKDCPVFLF